MAANKEDIIGFLQDKNVPGDEIVYNDLADEILDYPPEPRIFNYQQCVAMAVAIRKGYRIG